MNPPADAMEQPTHGGADSVGLWSAFARSVRNNIVAEVAVQIVRIGGLIILARALSPQDFGLLKVLMVVGAFVTLFIEAGIPEALIQRPDLRREHEVTAWWLTIAFSFIFVAGCYFAAPWAAAVMEMKNLAFGMRLLCIPLLFEGIAICANARMRRELRFGALAAADIIAETSFVVVALVVLFKGNPIWSLPAGLAARLAAHGLVIVVADRRLPLGTPRWGAARELCRFAASVMLGGNLLTSAAANADYLLVARLLGTTALGFYSMSWDLLQFIPARLYRIAGRVAFPAFCKLQDNNRELALAYRSFVGYIGRVVLPMAGCVAIAAPELLESIYGPKWLPAAVPMRILTVGLALVGLRIGIGTVYYAKNYPSIDIYLNGSRLIGIVVGVVLGAPFGLVGVCGAVAMVESIIGIAGQYVVCRLVGMQLGELIISLIPGLRTAAVTMLATGFGKLLGMVLGIPAPLVLAVIVVPPAIAFCWLQSGELAGMVRQAFSRTQPA